MNNYFDNIEDFVNGNLKGNELIEFESALKKDPLLREETEQHKILVQRLHDLGMRNRIKKNLIDSTRVSGIKWPLQVIIAIALFVLIIFLYFKLTTKSDSNQVVPESKIIEKSDSLTKGNKIFAENESNSKEQQKTSFPEIQNTINQLPDKDLLNAYDELVAAFDEVEYQIMGESSRDESIEIKLNQAKALLKKGDAMRAKSLSQEVVKNNNALYKDEADWLLAVSWMKIRRDSAILFLGNIAKNPNQEFRTNAIRVLARLEEYPKHQ